MNGCNEMMERAGIQAAAPIGLSGRDCGSIRVWMVDDNGAFRTLLATVLADEGLEIERQFSSPVEVLQALSRERAPDIILLDIEMGEDNGLDAIRPIKALARETHVLMLTTFAQSEARERAFREEASDFMLKTWLVSEIAMHIRQAMELGSVAALLTPFLGRGRAVAKPAEPETEMVAKTGIAERWGTYLRGLLKLSTS
jgi:DNA-binding NarL/FixJ family response regulator